MQVTISDKLIERMITNLVENCLFDDFGAKTIKAAGVPKKALVVKEIMADPKSMAAVERYLAKYINDADVIYDAICEAPLPALTRFERACIKAEDAE